ncbi:hypothetical protein OH77DRAFT_430289 [Trametes cingulata]|nr:hypothetical protein OH77DRAFT_430289 [Trametes cingulata]
MGTGFLGHRRVTTYRIPRLPCLVTSLILMDACDVLASVRVPFSHVQHLHRRLLLSGRDASPHRQEWKKPLYGLVLEAGSPFAREGHSLCHSLSQSPHAAQSRIALEMFLNISRNSPPVSRGATATVLPTSGTVSGSTGSMSARCRPESRILRD